MKSWGHLFLYFGCCLHSLAIPESIVSLCEVDAYIQVKHGERVLMNFNKSKRLVPVGVDSIYSRSGHLTSLSTLSGQVVTDEFPEDHPHQSGIWSAWTQTEFNGRIVDFWNVNKGQGYVEHCEVLELDDDPFRGFKVELAHVDLTSGLPVDVLTEYWTISDFNIQQEFWSFDLLSEQICASDDPLTVMEYRYGGMAIRLASEWSDTLEYDVLTSEGKDRRSGDQKPARWVMYSGQLDGVDVSVVVMCHPCNFRYPQIARISPRFPYFVWSPGNREPFEITPDKPYRALYRYLIFSEIPDRDCIDELFLQFSKK